jgi:hypothetical protein
MSEEEKKEERAEKEKPDRLETYVKFAGIIGGLIEHSF